MTHPWFHATGTPRVLAHRGFVPPDSEGIVENTLAAFAAAHAAGATYVESDCHVTSDGVVVLFHDDNLAHVTGDPRRIADVRHAELAAIMADRGGLLTAVEALEAFPTLRFNLDVKSDGATRLGRLIPPYADRVLITSFSDRRRRAALTAAIERGAIPATSAGQGTVIRMLLARATGSKKLVRRVLKRIDALQVPERFGWFRLVTTGFVRAAHDAGCEVHVWTINDTPTMMRLLELGVDGIVTDRTDLALAAMAARR